MSEPATTHVLGLRITPLTRRRLRPFRANRRGLWSGQTQR